MGFLDNVFKPNKTTNKKNNPNNNNTNPLANFGKSLQTNFTTVTGGGASKFTGPGQSLGGAQPGEVLDIILSEPGTLGIRIEKKSNNTASAIVAHVVPGSQAAIAGLQRGDVICCAGSQGQHEIQYDMFLEIAKSTQRPIYLEARRLTPTKSASSSAGAAAAAAGPTGRGGGGGSADAESRRKAMIAAAEAREQVHKQKLRPMNKKSAHKTTTTTQQQDVNNFTSAELQPQTEAARIAMRAVKRDEQRLAQELGYNPYAAANSTAGQARTATATTQYGELNSGSGSGGISTTTGTSSATASTAIPVVAPPLDPTTSAVREEHPLPEEFEDAFVTIISQSDTAASKTGLKIARTLILNATTKGQQRTEEEEAAKFRKVRLDNPKIKQAIVEVPGNIQLLLSVGFQLVECENHNESLLVFPPQSTGPVWLPTALRRMEHQEQAL